MDFQHRLPAGCVDVHMSLKGDELRVTAKARTKAAPALVPAAARLGPPAPDQAPQVTVLALMHDMAVRRASHLHVSAGRLAQYRCEGHLVPVQGAYFDDAQLAAEVEALVPAALRRSLQQLVASAHRLGTRPLAPFPALFFLFVNWRCGHVASRWPEDPDSNQARLSAVDQEGED